MMPTQGIVFNQCSLSDGLLSTTMASIKLTMLSLRDWLVMTTAEWERVFDSEVL